MTFKRILKGKERVKQKEKRLGRKRQENQNPKATLWVQGQPGLYETLPQNGGNCVGVARGKKEPTALKAVRGRHTWLRDRSSPQSSNDSNSIHNNSMGVTAGATRHPSPHLPVLTFMKTHETKTKRYGDLVVRQFNLSSPLLLPVSRTVCYSSRVLVGPRSHAGIPVWSPVSLTLGLVERV